MSGRFGVAACVLALASGASTPGPTPVPTTIATTRFTIDRFNLWMLNVTASNTPDVSIGSRNRFGDAGTLVSTAVLIQTPATSTWLFAATRIDVLLFSRAPSTSPRSISDFVLTLYSDDGSATHNPGLQFSTPLPLTGQSTPLATSRASWYAIDVSQAGWPLLLPSTYYWVVLTPGSPLASPPNGAVWGGINASAPGTPLYSGYSPDSPLFTARELSSERFAFDGAFAATTAAAVSFLASATNWPTVPNAAVRFTNWQAVPGASDVRYGLQVIGMQAPLSATVTPSASMSPSCSASQSSSPSQTATLTTSCTRTRTGTQTRSPSSSRTPSQSSTLAPTPSTSASGSQSATASQVRTPSTSGTPSRSQSPSQSASPSPSASPSATGSPSASGTGSQSVSSSQSPTASQALSPSQTLTSTQSLTPTPTQTVSQTQSSSSTATPSQSGSPSTSSTQTPSGTGTLSGTPSQSATASVTATRSQTGTQSSSPSQTASNPLPLGLAFVDRATAALVEASLTLSDSQPAVVLGVNLSRCPPRDPPAVLACTTTTVNGSVVLLTDPPGPGATVVCDPPPASESSGPLYPAATTSLVSLRAAYRSGPGVGALTCGVFAADEPLATATVAFTVLPTLWPLVSDAIVVSAAGLARSMLLATRYNITPALLGAAGAAALDAALADSRAVLAAVRETAPALPPVSDSEGVVASFTLTGPYLVALRSRVAAFSGNVSVGLGPVACSVLATSDDAAWALVLTPHASAICGDDTDCGYQTLALANPSPSGNVVVDDGTPPPPQHQRRGLAAITFDVLGAGLAFPPFCEVGCLPQGAFPVAFDARASVSSFIPGTASALGSVSRVDVSAFSSLGVFYSRACSATGLYVDPAVGGCTNASDPESFNCAFGSGDACSPCPVGGLCPGGFRAWPRAGYWVAVESTGTVLPCPFPAESRCAGWGVASGATRCGPGYRANSYLCSSCAAEFYSSEDGSCVACPVVVGVWDRVQGILILVSAVAGCAALVFGTLLAVVWCTGGAIVGGASRAFALVAWSLSAAQVVSLVGSTASDYVAPELRVLLGGLAVLQLESVARPAACTGSYAFQSEVIVLAAACGVWTFAAVCYYSRPFVSRPDSCGCFRQRQCRAACSTMGRVALTLAIVAFPAATSAGVRMLDCTTVEVPATPAALAALDGSPDLAHSNSTTATAPGLIVVALLSSDPFFVCWAGSHREAGALAVAAVVYFVAGMPLVVMSWLVLPDICRCRRRAAADAKSPDAPTAPKGCMRCAPTEPDPILAPVVSDYKPEAWYTKFIDLALLLLLSTLHALLPAPVTVNLVTIKAALSASAALAVAAHIVVSRPFADVERWKGPVRVLLLTVSACGSILNACATAVREGFDAPPSLPESVRVSSYLLLALWVVALAVLFVGFARALVVESILEAQRRKPPPLPPPTPPTPPPPPPEPEPAEVDVEGAWVRPADDADIALEEGREPPARPARVPRTRSPWLPPTADGRRADWDRLGYFASRSKGAGSGSVRAPGPGGVSATPSGQQLRVESTPARAVGGAARAKADIVPLPPDEDAVDAAVPFAPAATSERRNGSYTFAADPPRGRDGGSASVLSRSGRGLPGPWLASPGR